MNRKIIVYLADTHAGHRLGLMKPGLLLYEEDETGNEEALTPKLTATQEYLWRCYQEDIEGVVNLAGDDDMYVFHVGDLTQGVKYKNQLVSTRIANQIIIAKGNMEQWLNIPNVKELRLISGTGSHIFGESSSPILLCEMLDPLYNAKVSVCYHDRVNIDGVITDCAHHGPSSGIREWTQGNQLRYYLKSIIHHDVLRGKHPPHLVVRAHFHKLWSETVRSRINKTLLDFLIAIESKEGGSFDLSQISTGSSLYKSNIILLPSYCGMGEYGRQATSSSSTLSNGLVAAEIIDGKLHKLHYFEREVDLRRDSII